MLHRANYLPVYAYIIARYSIKQDGHLPRIESDAMIYCQIYPARIDVITEGGMVDFCSILIRIGSRFVDRYGIR